jgi:hypothetical protein
MLHVQGYYRLLQATVAIDRSGQEKKCFQAPEGALLLVNGFEREGPLVEVLYAGRRLLMFEEDLVQRAQPVEGLRLYHKAR